MKKLVLLFFFFFSKQVFAQNYYGLGSNYLISKHDLYKPILAKNGVKSLFITSPTSVDQYSKTVLFERFVYDSNGYLTIYSRQNQYFIRSDSSDFRRNYSKETIGMGYSFSYNKLKQLNTISVSHSFNPGIADYHFKGKYRTEVNGQIHFFIQEAEINKIRLYYNKKNNIERASVINWFRLD